MTVSLHADPVDMVAYGLDRDHVRSLLRADLGACRHCRVDITLKDVETVESDPDRVRDWVGLCREVIDDVFG